MGGHSRRRYDALFKLLTDSFVGLIYFATSIKILKTSPTQRQSTLPESDLFMVQKKASDGKKVSRQHAPTITAVTHALRK